MEAPSLAQALADDTRFRPAATQPFTKAVVRSQELDMRKAAMEAAKDAKEAKKREMFENSIKLTTPNVGRRFADIARETGKQGYYEAFSKETPYEKDISLYNTSLKNKETENMYNDDKKVADAFRNRTALVPQAFGEAIEAGDNDRLRAYAKNNALDTDIATVYETKDINGNDFVHHTFNGIPEIDTGKFIPLRLNQMFKGSDKEIEGGIKDRAGFYQYVQQLSDKDLENAALADVKSSPALKNNVIQHHRDEAYKIFDEMKVKDPKVDVEKAKIEIASKLLKDEYVAHYADRTGKLPDVNKKTEAAGGSVDPSTIFNSDFTDLNQAEPVLSKAGIIKGGKDLQFLQGQGELISLSPPTVTGGNIKDEGGYSVKYDNLKLVYLPTKNEWYATGESTVPGKGRDQGKMVKKDDAIKITPTTIGSLASIFKVPSPKLEEILNNRMKEAGIDKTVSYNTAASSYNKKTNTVVSRGSGNKTTPAKSQSGKKKISGF